MNSQPEDWEIAFRNQLRKAMPEVAVPPEAVVRIEKRILGALPSSPTAKTRPIKVVRFPDRRRSTRPMMRWVAAVALAIVMIGSLGPRVDRLQRKWIGPHATFPISAPFAFAGVASAGGLTVPGIGQQVNNISFELLTDLPELPERGPMERAEIAFSPWFVESVRVRLGIQEPVRTERVGLPAVGPVKAYRAGPFALYAGGGWTYDPGEPATAAPAPQPLSDEEAMRIASGWLEDAGLFPTGAVYMWVASTAAGSSVYLTPAAEAPLAAVDDPPGIWVLIRSRAVVAASGIWPTGSTQAGEVPLRTVQEAWADLQAGTGAVVGTTGPVPAPLRSSMQIEKVSLDRALVRSLDNRWYYVPVVAFQGQIHDVNGIGHKALAYVTAVKPTPGQGAFELKAEFPNAPASLPLVQIDRPEKQLFHEWTPDTALSTFRTPSPESVREAAIRVATAAGVDPESMGTPELHWSREQVFASVPVKWNGLPAIQTGGDPQQLPSVWIRFGLDGSIVAASVHDTVASVTGDSIPLISPEEAWQQIQAGHGTVKVLGERDFPNAHFAAHRTTIHRVELAYNVDDRTWSDGHPAVPSYFFWGIAVVGEDFTEHEVVVVIPAIRRP